MSTPKRRRLTWYKCRKCGSIEHEMDWGWKDRNLYYALKKERLCENCARGIKVECA